MTTLEPSFLIGSFSYLQVIILILVGNKDMHESLDEFKFGQIPLPTPELSAFARLKN